MKEILSTQKTFIKGTFIFYCLSFLAIFLGCRKEPHAISTAVSGYVFCDLVSNEMRNVTWCEGAGERTVTNVMTIKDLTSELRKIKGVSADFRKKSAVIGVLRYDVNSRTNIEVNFYNRGIVTVNDDSYFIDSKMIDKVVTIIHQPAAEQVDGQP